MDDEIEGYLACEFCEGAVGGGDLIDGIDLDSETDLDEPAEGL